MKYQKINLFMSTVIRDFAVISLVGFSQVTVLIAITLQAVGVFMSQLQMNELFPNTYAQNVNRA